MDAEDAVATEVVEEAAQEEAVETEVAAAAEADQEAAVVTEYDHHQR